MKKITFINQYYKPLYTPPAKRLSALAEHFNKKGWDVRVITGIPNYPNGKLLKGYNLFFKKEKIESVKVYRFYEIPLKNKGFIKRLINYLSFTFSLGFSWPIIFNSDIIFISSPPLFSALHAFFLSKILRKKVIFDIRDLWPESAVDMGMIKKQSFVYKFFDWINKKIIFKQVDLITTATYSQREYLKKFTSKPIYVLTNFADNKKIKKTNTNKKINIIFTGIITEVQNLIFFLEANKDKEIRKKFEWHIVGDGEEKKYLEKFVRKNKMDNVFFYGYKPKKFCDEKINEGDLGLIPLKETKTFKGAIPSKFFEYLSFGKPILTYWSVDLKEIINKNNIGYFINNKKDLINKMKHIEKKELKSKSKKVIKTFKEKFEKEKTCNNFYKFILKKLK